jgi:transposase
MLGLLMMQAQSSTAQSSVSGSFKLLNHNSGALPLIDQVLSRFGLRDILLEALGENRYSDAIIVLVKNFLIERSALYRIKEWTARYNPALVAGGQLGDDVFARALDDLFEADRASLLTRIILSVVKAYDVDLSQIHQDTTSVSVTGAYIHQSPKALQLKRGHSKNHRPDLKQLVYELSVTRDGAIPVLFKSHDGNKTDDTLHWDNWQTLRGILGCSDFLYVADSKLCVSKTLMNIDRNQGRFITILPKTRAETAAFSDEMENSSVRWENVDALKSSRKKKIIDVFETATGIYQMREGFRIHWFRSSEKMRRDEEEREEKIDNAYQYLQDLTDPVRKKKPKTEKTLRKKAESILLKCGVEEWLQIDIALEKVENFKQLSRGPASADTVYRKTVHWIPHIKITRDENVIARAKLMDGIFPLVTNTDLKAKDVLKAYKYQPTLEKRHALLKSGLLVAPVFLKKNTRIEALMFVCFLGQLVCALLERQLRAAMKKHHLKQIEILPEERPSTHPTAQAVFRVFSTQAKRLLQSQDGAIVQVFTEPLTDIQKKILDLLEISPEVYT